MSFFQLLASFMSVSVITSVLMLISSFALGLIMTPSDFGVYSYTQSFLMLMLNFVPFGTSMAFGIFMYKSTPKEYTKIVSNGLFFVIPSSTLLLLCLGSIASFLNVFSFDYSLFCIVLFIGFSTSISLSLIVYLRTSQKVKLYSIYFILFTLLTSGGSLLGYYYFNSVIGLYKVYACGLLFFSVISCVYLRSHLNVSIVIEGLADIYIWSIKYGFPIVLSSMAMSFMVLGDKIILGNEVSSQKLALYSIAVLIASTSLFLVNNFAAAWGAYLVKNLASDTPEAAFNEYKRIRNKLYLVACIIPVVLSLQLGVYLLVYSEKYPDLSLCIITLTVGYAFLGASKFFMGYMNYYGKNTMVFVSSLIGIVTLLCVYYSMTVSDVMSMAIAVSLGFVAQFIFCLGYSNRLLVNLNVVR